MIAILWGGPADGRAMIIPERDNHQLRVMVGEKEPLASWGVLENMLTLFPKYKIATYQRQEVAGLPRSEMTIYTFLGVE